MIEIEGEILFIDKIIKITEVVENTYKVKNYYFKLLYYNDNCIIIKNENKQYIINYRNEILDYLKLVLPATNF